VVPHPHLPIIASCGIDSEGKIFDVGTDLTYSEEKAKIITENNKVPRVPGLQRGQISLQHLWNLLSRMRRGEEDLEIADFGMDNDEESDTTEPTEEEIQEQAAQRRCDSADVMRQEGNDCFKSGDFAQALEFYSSSIEQLQFTFGSTDIQQRKKSTHIVCLLNRAACYNKLGRFELTLSDCAEVLSYEAANLKALFRRATAYIELGRIAEGQADINTILITWPMNDEVQKLLDMIEQAKQKEKK